MELTKRIGVILAGGLGKRMNSHLPKPALQRVIHKMDCYIKSQKSQIKKTSLKIIYIYIL